MPKSIQARQNIRSQLVPGGHIGLFMGSQNLREVWPEIVRWTALNSPISLELLHCDLAPCLRLGRYRQKSGRRAAVPYPVGHRHKQGLGLIVRSTDWQWMGGKP